MTINTFRKARKRLGLTQEEVARRSGVTQNTVSELETGRNSNPTWQVLSAVAKALDSTPERLLPPKPLKSSARNGATVTSTRQEAP